MKCNQNTISTESATLGKRNIFLIHNVVRQCSAGGAFWFNLTYMFEKYKDVKQKISSLSKT